VQVEELARFTAGSANLPDFFERPAIEDRNPLVGAVRDV
jgi:hypothetical protein